MPHVAFTSNLRRHIECPATDVDGQTVREALKEVFRQNAALEDYIVDEHGRLRKHVVIFVDGDPVFDRDQLSDPVSPSSEIYVMQALSGG